MDSNTAVTLAATAYCDPTSSSNRAKQLAWAIVMGFGLSACASSPAARPAVSVRVVERNANTAVTLAAIAYCDKSSIQSTLNRYLDDWTAVWVADEQINGNVAFIAYDGSSQYAVAIRGSLLEFNWQAFENWFEQDLNAFVEANWPYGSDGSSKVAQGAMDGLTHLSNLVDSSSGSSVSLLAFLQANAVAGNLPITVTGHSLGGNLATVLAPWLVDQIQKAGGTPPPMSIYTFAAPAAGNQSYANDYDIQFQGVSWRYVMEDDIVPTFPLPSLMRRMSSWYSPAPEASQISVTYDGYTVTLQEAIASIAGAIEVSELGYGSHYTQTNQSQGTVSVATTYCNKWQDNTIEDWFDTVGCHHSILQYGPAVGASAVTCVTPSGEAASRQPR